ncbi:hypothetical protein INR49_001039 [Caranx melampygus]|nr:hypothetical protein INR49_001039 [Caranx melampygus]
MVCASLIFGIAAKPYKPRTKLTDEAFQDTVMSIDDNGKMSWTVVVEPPEDLDETGYDVDPNMLIWKSMVGKQQDKPPLMAEEDFDKLNHPSMADLLRVQIQNQDFQSAADIQAELTQEKPNMKYEEPEEDRDDVDHPVLSEVAEEPEENSEEAYNKAREALMRYLAPLTAEYVRLSDPERDEDDLYHHDDQPSPVQMELLQREVREGSEVRVHLQPEEDMDNMYHQDLLLPIPYQDDAAAAAPLDLPSERKHSEPEEDLDALYHQ